LANNVTRSASASKKHRTQKRGKNLFTRRRDACHTLHYPGVRSEDLMATFVRNHRFETPLKKSKKEAN
jgi:hypothetical protein